MNIQETRLEGVVIITPDLYEDHRGFFMESYNKEKMLSLGIKQHEFIQDNHSLSVEAGTLRGLHYQLNPKSQTKLVRVLSGAIYDVVVDIRKSSPTFGQWQGQQPNYLYKKGEIHMNILITGGAGFIGSNFVRFMVNKYPDYHLINLDKLTYAGNLGNLVDLEDSANYNFVKGDICNNELIREVFKTYKPDIVVNFAAESHVDRSILEPEIFLKTNILGTQVLLDAAKENNIKKYVQISTDEVYGSLGETGYFTEDTPISPNSPYSASKASADLLVRAYHETYGLNVNITRCSNNYGPYHFPEKLIPLMITNALEDKRLPVYGDGGNVRDWLHVKDHASAIDLVIHAGEPGHVYNIGGHNEMSNIDIVELILESLGRSKELIQFVADRLGHDKRYAIDPSKIEKQLGWKPQYSFELGIKETITWYLENPNWWMRIKTGQYRDYYTQQYGERMYG